ncbi:type VI secretion system baseplate subunit TssG, partial [Escherichia coli]|nr:type VI secretion system baseplate subunit TssG [Escherichia coli]
AASSYLSPGNPPADKEQNDPLAQVFHNACSYNFFAMAELLHRLAKGEKGTPELSLRDDPAQETLRFSADASLAFPCSDISALKRDTSGAFRMTTTFMGLQGSQSPLPGYYLDHLAWKAVHEQSPVGDFLDMFSHRLTQFVWHIWRKYRYHISFRNGGVDAFSQRMYSLVGLGHRQLRDKLAINHSKMLAYSGILANPGRSPEIICGLVSHCFDLSEVPLQNWQRRKVDIEPDQQNSLGSYSLKNGEKLAGRSV